MATVINGNTGVDKVQDDAVNPVTDIASGIPCFSAYPTINQTLPNGSFTKINYQTEEFDTTGAYDATNSRFTPQVAGYYKVVVALGLDANPVSAGGGLLAMLYKNGSLLKYVTPQLSTGSYSTLGGCIAYLNGSTDYIEIYGYLAGTSLTVHGGNSPMTSYFQAHLIVGA